MSYLDGSDDWVSHGRIMLSQRAVKYLKLFNGRGLCSHFLSESLREQEVWGGTRLLELMKDEYNRNSINTPISLHG